MSRLRVTVKAAAARLLVSSSLLVWHGRRDSGAIALTFDDGPDPDCTPRVLDALDAARIRATFFLEGRRVLRHPELAREVLRRGHTIGNHSLSHPPFRRLSLAAMGEEIDQGAAAIASVLGCRPTLFRPPYGGFSPRLLYATAIRGLTLVLFSVDSGDWGGAGEGAILSNMGGTAVRAGDILLFHDNSPRTAGCLPEVIHRLGARGLRFVTVGEIADGAAPGPALAEDARGTWIL